MISQFSFTIDVREWGFVDPRADLVREARAQPEIRAIMTSDVWTSVRTDVRRHAKRAFQRSSHSQVASG